MNIQFLSPEQCQRALVLNWTATLIAKSMNLDLRIPTALVGDTGCGKTDAVRAFYKDLSSKAASVNKVTKLWSVRMSHILPEDLGGYAAKDETTKKLVHYMLDCLPFDCEDMGVIFLDEFDRAPTDNQNASMPLVYGDDFHGHSLSSNAYVVLALNGSADTYTTPLSQAIRTRVCSLFVSRNSGDGYASYEKWATANGIPEVVKMFHRVSGNLIASTNEFTELAVCTPRTLDMAGMITLARDQINKKGTLEIDDVYPACIAGVIGAQAAAQYIVNEQMLKDTNPEDVILHPDTAKIPSYAIINYLVQAVCNILQNDSDRNNKAIGVLRYIKRIDNQEWARMFMDRIGDTVPSIVTNPEFQRHIARR